MAACVYGLLTGFVLTNCCAQKAAIVQQIQSVSQKVAVAGHLSTKYELSKGLALWSGAYVV